MRSNEKGQTLVLAVVALVILLVALLFLFDLQSIIRIKVKAQSAADAAALASAKWQLETLNLIGEMNIIKACTVLVSDIPPYGDDSPEGITASSDLLCEMQTRAAFVGPVIGFGSAQQAAKNNGMNPNAFFTSVVTKHIERLGADLNGFTAADLPGATYQDNYYFGVPKLIENYDWRRPYAEMIANVNFAQAGIAAAPNVEYSGLPLVTPPWLMDLNLYNAISSEYWCYPTLRSLVKYYDFDGKWWDVTIVGDFSRFPQESEYTPVFVEMGGAGDLSAYGAAGPYLPTLAAQRNLQLADSYDKGDPNDTDGINSPLPYVRWCNYEQRWTSMQVADIWLGDEYLRSGIRPEYAYGGPVSKMRCETEPSVVSESYNVKGNYGGDSGDPFIYRDSNLDPAMPVGGKDSGLRQKQLTTSVSTAMAKPLGCLETQAGSDRYQPNSVSMVLPVFDKTRLIPIAMQDSSDLYNPFSEESEQLLQFLLWLQDIDDLDNPGSQPPGSMGPWFLRCLQRLNNPQWRAKGYNRNYTYQPPGETPPYDPGTGTGAGWLQMGHIYQYDDTGNAVAILETNEDTCDPRPGGTGGGGPLIVH